MVHHPQFENVLCQLQTIRQQQMNSNEWWSLFPIVDGQTKYGINKRKWGRERRINIPVIEVKLSIFIDPLRLEIYVILTFLTYVENSFIYEKWMCAIMVVEAVPYRARGSVYREIYTYVIRSSI